MDKKQLALSVGGLLYTPATNPGIAHHIIANDMACLTSVALCLEDSIPDSEIDIAESQLKSTLSDLTKSEKKLPAIFVRVRDPKHLKHVHDLIGEDRIILTGYVFPKFDLSNASEYLDTMRDINRESEHMIYCMPILESAAVAKGYGRMENLRRLRTVLDDYEDLILNVRVGGNDFCNLYGLRRSVSQTIYDIGVVRDILMDILNTFSDDYVLSGPVWEYYGENENEPWANGLRRELELDRLNGFMGKTVIHPSQLPIVFESMRVSRTDYMDAMAIMNWKDPHVAVAAACDHGRMNEVKCHGRWAEKILLRADIYGIREE